MQLQKTSETIHSFARSLKRVLCALAPTHFVGAALSGRLFRRDRGAATEFTSQRGTGRCQRETIARGYGCAA